MPAAQTGGNGGSRKADFYKYYRANPDKLKGKSIDEAYAAMRRNVQTRTNFNTKLNNRTGGTQDDGRTAAIQRRIAKKNGNPMTMENTNPLSGIKNPLASRNGKTPWQRLNAKIDSFNGSAQEHLDAVHNKMAKAGNPLANKNGQTPYDRLIGRKPHTLVADKTKNKVSAAKLRNLGL